MAVAPPRSSRDLRLLTSSVVVSSLGTWSYNVGIAVYAYDRTHSTAWVAVATVGRYVPALAITWALSGLADRLPRRRLAVATDLACAATMVALTVVAALNGPLLLAIALAAVSSAVARIHAAAALAVGADVVVESQLVRSASLISTSEAVATAIGPALASLVLAVTTPAVLFLLNGATFLASAVLLLGVRAVPRRPRPSAPRTDEAAPSVVRLMWPLLAARTLAAVVYGGDVVLLAVVATQQLRQGTSGYGWLLAAAGTGGLLCALALQRRKALSGTARSATLGMAVYCLPLVAFLAAPDLAGGLAIQLVRGAGCVLVTTTVVAALQRAVPSDVSGRVFGQANSLVLAGTCVGALAAPLLLHAVGLDTTLVVFAVAPLAAQLATVPATRRLDVRAAALAQELDPRVTTLRSLELFHDAARWTLYEVADAAVEVQAGDGVVLVAEGDPSDSLFLLLDGEVIVTASRDGGDVVLRRMTAPCYFGEIGLLHGVARTATVTAAGHCRLWRIPAEAFLGAAAQAGVSGALTDSVRVRFATGVGSGRG